MYYTTYVHPIHPRVLRLFSVFAFSRSYAVLFFARALQGVGSSCSSVSGEKFYYLHIAQWDKTRKKVHFLQDKLPQRLKSACFEIFSNRAALKGPTEWEFFFSKNIDFSLWGNCATTQTHIWNGLFFAF